ncbi:MAG: YcxB family protein [bacterium]
MSEICKAKYRWTREEHLRAMRYHYRLKLRRVLLLMKVFSVSLLAFMGIVLLVWVLFESSSPSSLPSSSPPPFWALLLLTIFCLYWLTIDRLNAWNATRGFSKRPDANMQVEWQLSHEKIQLWSELNEATLDWKSFLRVVESKEGFLFYSLQNLFNWLPFSAFESPDCIARVREFIRENNIPLVEPRGGSLPYWAKSGG